MSPKASASGPLSPSFDVPGVLKSAGLSARIVRFAAGALIFGQGAQANSEFYVHEGGIKLSVLSSAGKEAVVAMLGRGDFFGEGCLAGQPLRMGTAQGRHDEALLRIQKRDMLRMLHEPSLLARASVRAGLTLAISHQR